MRAQDVDVLVSVLDVQCGEVVCDICVVHRHAIVIVVIGDHILLSFPLVQFYFASQFSLLVVL